MNNRMDERGTQELKRDFVEAEATLRMLAGVSSPEGLEERIKARLMDGAQRGQVLAWKSGEQEPPGWLRSAAMRGLAAAAIVGAVVGGGWSVASYGRHSAAPQAITLPHLAVPGGFSSAGAMRTPQTLHPPAVPHAPHKMKSTTSTKGKMKANRRHAYKQVGVHAKGQPQKAVSTNR